MSRIEALVVGLLAAGCSTSPCQQMANTLTSKTASCTASFAVNVNQCDLACSAIDQTAIDQAASCLAAVPACDPSDESAFETASTDCAEDLKNVSSECLSAVMSPNVNPGDGGSNSGTYDCSSAGRCSGDMPPTQSGVATCEAAEAGACGSQFNAFALCIRSNETCGLDGGSTDLSDCTAQVTSLEDCCNANTGAAGCSEFGGS